MPNFSSISCFHEKLLYADDSCYKYELLSALDSCKQLMIANMKKADWNFHVDTKVDTFAKFQYSRLIFVFTNCYQLLTAVDS